MKKHIFISAGEVSGDIHGSFLIRKLHELNPELKITGFGSVEMSKAGADIVKDFARYSGVGLVENIPSMLPMKEVLSLAKKYFNENKPDLVILIDNQGFNLQLAAIVKKHQIPLVYYIGPQEWIWGFKKGPLRVINKVDKLIAVFKKEYDLYCTFTDKAEFVGHPLLDIIKPAEKTLVRRENGLAESGRVIGLMPGSRLHEINSLLPVFLETAKLMKKQEPGLEFILMTSEIWKEYILKNFDLHGIRLIAGNSSYYMQACDLLLVASGTVTLEAALLKIPVIASYKLAKLSYFIARLLIKLDYFTLPNIISEKRIIPEFVQNGVNAHNLSRQAFTLLNDEEAREKMLTGYEQVKEALKPDGAINRAAQIILGMTETI